MVSAHKAIPLPIGRGCPEGAGEGRFQDKESKKTYISKIAPIIFARKLRNHQTDAEKILWRELRQRRFSGFRFRRQEIIGPYIADFICMAKALIIEADGAHHDVDTDAARDNFLRSHGYRVLRFNNHDIKRNLSFVLENIWVALHDTSFDPNAILPSSGLSGHLLPTGRRVIAGECK